MNSKQVCSTSPWTPRGGGGSRAGLSSLRGSLEVAMKFSLSGGREPLTPEQVEKLVELVKGMVVREVRVASGVVEVDMGEAFRGEVKQ